jgi:hypothetical protein
MGTLSQSCGNNTLVIGRPSDQGMDCGQCSTELGHADALDKAKLGPRPNRSKVRQQIRDYILNMLGAPTIRIEMDEQNLDFCIDQSLKIIEDYATGEYFTYYVFTTTNGQSVYEMPPEVGYIRSIAYKEHGTFAFQASDLDGAIPVEYFYPGGAYASIQGGLIDPIQPMWGRMGEWVLYKQYEQTYSRVASNIGGWEFLGSQRHIKLYPTPHAPQKVIVRYIQKMKDWNTVTQAMQEGALSYAKEILGRVRSKYRNPPGPNGGIQLDGETLLQEAKDEREKWKDALVYQFGEPLPITLD